MDKIHYYSQGDDIELSRHLHIKARNHRKPLETRLIAAHRAVCRTLIMQFPSFVFDNIHSGFCLYFVPFCAVVQMNGAEKEKRAKETGYIVTESTIFASIIFNG